MPRKNKGLTANGEKKEPKIDSKINGSAEKLEALKLQDRKKVPLRIDSKTIIMVLPENCNPEYAKQYLENKGIVDKKCMDRLKANGRKSKKQTMV